MASGPVGIYGIVEKVTFEPDEAKAERLQVFGAFAYVDGGLSRSLGVSEAAKGYLYFRLPPANVTSPEEMTTIRREWADLKAVAGTGQAVGFGNWGYSGRFSGLVPQAGSGEAPHIFARGSQGGELADLRVYPAAQKRGSPVPYQTNAGIVKLTESSHGAVIKQLRDVLRK
jgi:hypothetical protein